MTQAATEAGYSQTTAARGASELLRSQKVRTAIEAALDNAGISEERLAEISKAGLSARKTSYLVHGGEIKTMKSPDWAARHRFLDTVLRLRGAYPAEKIDITAETYEERVKRIWEASQVANANQ